MSVFIPSEKKKYLSLDVIGQLEDDLETDPLNYENWMKLIKQVFAKDKEEQVRSVMDRYLNIFKFDGEQWCSYINYEIDRSEFQNAQELFKKCLAVTTHVGLYRLYVSYVRRVNDVITGGEKARRTVIDAFEFALKNVGFDMSSSELWEDYLEFLKSWTPTATWEQQQKNDFIRKVYKQLLVIPNEKLEKIWPVYTNWENEVNPVTAKKFIGEKSANYMLARSWYIEWTNVTERLLQRSPVIPFSLEQNRQLVQRQKLLWYKWLELEKENKLELKDDLLQQRIEYVYKQSLATLPFVPELWFKYNKFWLNSNEEANLNKCINLLSEGLVLNPRSFLLSFQLSELYEKDNSSNKSTETFNNLIEILVKDYNNVTEKIENITKINETEKVEERSKRDVSSIENEENSKQNDNDDDDDDDINYVPMESPLSRLSQSEVDQLASLQERQSNLNKSITFVYIKLMNAVKRSGGIKEARSVFKNARTSYKPIGYEFYVSNALLEYYSDNKKTPNRIFELGMKVFNKCGGFLLSYLDYLIMTNDVENMRVLFEQGLTTLLKEITSDNEGVETSVGSSLAKSPAHLLQKKLKDEDIKEKKESIREMFKKFSKFETKYGDLNAVKSLENRYEQYFPEDDTMELFCDRYYEEGSIDVIRKFDLGGDLKRRKVDQPQQPQQQQQQQQPQVQQLRQQDSNGEPKIPPKPSTTPSISGIPNIPPIPTNLGGSTDGTSNNTNQNNNNNTNNNTNNSDGGNGYTNQFQTPGQDQYEQFVGSTTYGLLRALPSANYFGTVKDHVFDAKKLVELFANLPNVPNS